MTITDFQEKGFPDFRSNYYFLDLFSENEILKKLEKNKVIKLIHDKGLKDLTLNICCGEGCEHYLKLYHQKEIEKNLILDLKIREVNFPLKDFSNDLFHFLFVDWLLIQNPCETFSEKKKNLPGQEHPGLGALRKVFNILIEFSLDKNKDGIAIIPQYFHLAKIYHRKFSFIKPENEAIFKNIERDTKGIDFYSLIDLVKNGKLLNKKDNKIYKYIPVEMVYPIEDNLKKIIESKEFKSLIIEKLKEFEFEVLT